WTTLGRPGGADPARAAVWAPRSGPAARVKSRRTAAATSITDTMQAVTDVYAIPQEHLDFCATIGEIAREKIAPRSAEIDERAEYPWDVRKLLGEQDILGLPFPSEYGGTGTGTLMLNMAVEEIAKVDASCALILMVQELGTLPIQLFGSDELKERFLPRCATGVWSPAFSLSEDMK